MSTLYDSNGVVVEHDDGAQCQMCGHYDDNKNAEGVHPFMIMLQAFGGVLSGIALAIVNLYILPDRTWEQQETAFIAVFIMLPSIVLVLFLFGFQVLDMPEQWIKIVIWTIGSSSVMLMLMWLMDTLLILPSLVGGAS